MKKGIIAAILLVGILLLAGLFRHKEGNTPAPAALEQPPVSLAEKLNQIILPDLPPAGITLEEAVEQLRIQSFRSDTTTSETSQKGVNMVIISGGEKELPTDVGLKLKDVPLSEALRHITASVGMKYTVEPCAVAIRAHDDMRGQLPPKQQTTAIEQRMQKRIRPTVQFQGATLEEAVEYIRVGPGCIDTIDGEMPPPLNFVIKVRGGEERPQVSLYLNNIPLSEALRYIAEISGVRLRYDSSAVVITDDTTDRPNYPAAINPAGSLIIPHTALQGATLEEAVEFLRIKSRELDPAHKGINIEIKRGPRSPSIDLDLKQVPLSEALHYVAELSGHTLSFEGQQYILSPKVGE